MWNIISYILDVIFSFSWIVLFLFLCAVSSYFRERSEDDRKKDCCHNIILDIIDLVIVSVGALILAVIFFIALLRCLFRLEGLQADASSFLVLFTFRNICTLIFVSFITMILYRYLKVQEVIVRYKKQYPSGDPLILAIEFNNFVNVRDIVRLGSYDLNKKDGKDSAGNMYAPLQMAQRIDNKKIILYLKRHGAK